MEEIFPFLAFTSLFVLEFIVPEAFGDCGEVSLEHSKAGFFPRREHPFSSRLLDVPLCALIWDNSTFNVEILMEAHVGVIVVPGLECWKFPVLLLVEVGVLGE